MKKSIAKLLALFTEISFPLTILSTLWLKAIRKVGIGKLTDVIFMKIGLLPVHDPYYQPMINPKKHLKKPLNEDRKLTGIDLNVKEQHNILSKFNYNDELLKFPENNNKNTEYNYNNGSYCEGDAEYLYNMIRHFKPERIIEIGSGNSTLMAQNAIKQNKIENSNYKCNHICIEPYEMQWLQELDVELKRELVENIDVSFFEKLEKNDILFIDSSHMIRPQGDVLFEFLELLPTINSGVFVHVHDIFTPKDYPDNMVIKHHRFWNEQYLLEAFLSHNSKFRITGALNYLANNHQKEFDAKCPVFANQSGRQPGAFWMVCN
jgi:hypothetical protein